LKFFDDCKQAVVAYEDNLISQTALAEMLLGKNSSTGKLPVSADKYFVFGKGSAMVSNFISAIKDETIVNAKAEEMNLNVLQRMDSIALEGIAAHAYPGCEVVAMKNGKMIYNKTFGSFTYELNNPIQKTDLYDLASITKIACTTLACMKLYEDGKLDLKKTIGDYLPEAKKTNKKKIVVRDLLLHQAGLVPFIPFWKNCLNENGVLDNNFSTQKDATHTLPVAANLFMAADYMNTIWDKIYKSEVKPSSKNYVYSDLDLYFMKRICEAILKNETVESYVSREFYEPMQLKHLCFNPLQHGFKKEQIAPTERDNYFRHQLICGYVHDQGAAMSGGIQGHAGLFSNAEDLAKLMQMLCNKGEYNGKRYLKAYTVDYFTSKQSSISRRGLGFDKQEPDPNVASPTCKSASTATFGHTGFTGTSAWVDPKYNLVFVFLSNRVYPDAENKKIITMGIRTRMQELLYEAMKK
jgi:CubicO group peptidase (beta-lactamase class C family)